MHKSKETVNLPSLNALNLVYDHNAFLAAVCCQSINQELGLFDGALLHKDPKFPRKSQGNLPLSSPSICCNINIISYVPHPVAKISLKLAADKLVPSFPNSLRQVMSWYGTACCFLFVSVSDWNTLSSFMANRSFLKVSHDIQYFWRNLMLLSHGTSSSLPPWKFIQ